MDIVTKTEVSFLKVLQLLDGRGGVLDILDEEVGEPQRIRSIEN